MLEVLEKPQAPLAASFPSEVVSVRSAQGENLAVGVATLIELSWTVCVSLQWACRDSSASVSRGIWAVRI